MNELEALSQWARLRDIALPEPRMAITGSTETVCHDVQYVITRHQKWQLDEFLKMFNGGDND